ncbi:MAG: hypothetical protein H0X63_13000 [Flavobacteriales bacterium]|nr:hypothetical protein [Flavobacteriales bacterium]
MHIKKNKQLLSFFFITAFLLLKAVNLHAFSHTFEQDKQIHECELCEFYIANSENNPVTFTPDIPEITIPVIFIAAPFSVTYSSPSIITTYSGYYFNKPPPII